jgi:RimJ/RimL family protein N-acetyltransferase
MIVLETERLVLRRLSIEDAEFILVLLNEPGWLRFIGDKGVRNLDDARGYITSGPVDSYARHGFGLYHTATRADGKPIGICGLIKRPTLEDVDIGFAFTESVWGRGYATEAGLAVKHHAKHDIGLTRLVAITDPDNAASIKVLERLGLAFRERIRLTPEAPELNLMACIL